MQSRNSQKIQSKENSKENNWSIQEKETQGNQAAYQKPFGSQNIEDEELEELVYGWTTSDLTGDGRIEVWDNMEIIN